LERTTMSPWHCPIGIFNDKQNTPLLRFKRVFLKLGGCLNLSWHGLNRDSWSQQLKNWQLDYQDFSEHFKNDILTW